MLRLALRTKVHNLQLPSNLTGVTYQHGLLRFSQTRTFRASTRMHSEANEHSEIDHKITNPDTRMMNLETEVKEWKTDFKDFKAEMKDFKTEMKDFKTEMKDFRKDVFHRFDTLGTTFQSSQKEMALTFQSTLKEFAHDQQKQFAHFYARGFGILGIAALLIGGAWVLPVKENERLDAEIKKRAIVMSGANQILRGT